jgi:hypothetical protein
VDSQLLTVVFQAAVGITVTLLSVFLTGAIVLIATGDRTGRHSAHH